VPRLLLSARLLACALVAVLGAPACSHGPTSSAPAASPTVPSGLAATAVSSSQINLSWTASTGNVGVTAYLIERCQGSGCASFALVATSTSTRYSDTALAASTTYLYRVRAADGAGNTSDYSAIATATTHAAVPPPSAPTGLTATATSSTRISLAWTASTGTLTSRVTVSSVV